MEWLIELVFSVCLDFDFWFMNLFERWAPKWLIRTLDRFNEVVCRILDWKKSIYSGQIRFDLIKKKPPPYFDVYEYTSSCYDYRLRTNISDNGEEIIAHADTSFNGWQKLPQEVMGLILRPLNLPDRVRLTAVCKSWCAIVKEENCYLPRPMWVMVEEQEDESACLFYSLLDRQIVSMKVSYSVKFCIPMDNGWLFMIEENCQACMMNFITKEHIPLPHVQIKDFNIVDMKDFYIESCGFWLEYNRQCGGVHTNQCIVVLNPVDLKGNRKKLVYCRTGDDMWSTFDHPEDVHFSELVLCGNRLYASDVNNETWVCEFIGDKHTLRKLKAFPTVSREETNRITGTSFSLVESSGDLLLVAKICGRDLDLDWHSEESDYRNVTETTCFEIFRLDTFILQWVKVESLSDHALFLGIRGNKSLRTSATGIKGNSIYFAENNFLGKQNTFTSDYYNKCSLLVFNIGDNTIEPINIGENTTESSDSCLVHRAVWFKPY